VFNLQPGQGLGTVCCELIAYGLGTPSELLVEEPIAEYHGGGQRGDVWDLQDEMMKIQRRELQKLEDEELLEIIIMALTSGVLD
jgi:hypothetical protein